MEKKLIFKYFVFRCKQTFRLLNYSLDYSVCFVIFSLVLYFIKFPDYFYLIIYFSCISLLNKRKDKGFLGTLFAYKSYLIQIFENLIVFSYISLLLPKVTDYRIFILGMVWAIISPKITFTTQKITLKFIDTLPCHIFEWKCTLRKNLLSFIFYYILLFCSTYHPFTFIIVLFLFSTLLIETYKYRECKELYISYFQKFTLLDKYKTTLFYFNKILIPVFILYGFLNPMYSEYLLLFFIINLYYLEILSKKYKNYTDNEREIETNPIQILLLLIKATLIIPSLYSIYVNTQIATQKIRFYDRN